MLLVPGQLIMCEAVKALLFTFSVTGPSGNYCSELS